MSSDHPDSLTDARKCRPNIMSKPFERLHIDYQKRLCLRNKYAPAEEGGLE